MKNEQVARVIAFAGYKLKENPCPEDVEMWKEIQEVALRAEQAEKCDHFTCEDVKKLQEQLAELQKQNTILHEMLNESARLTDKMADGWCLVSPEDFEKLKQLSNQGDVK